jgi:hypothetical protein
MPDGQVLVVPPPPMAGVTECEGAVTSCVSTLKTFIEKNVAVAADATLSPMGKRAKQIPLAQAAIKAVWRQSDALATFGGKTLARLTALYSPPAIAPGNATQALLDREVREWFRGLSADERGKVLPKLLAGALPQVALALMRSPIPLDSDEQMIANAWKASVRAENEGEVVDLEMLDRVTAWADLLVERIAAMLAQTASLGDGGVREALHAFDAPDRGPFRVQYTPGKQAA